MREMRRVMLKRGVEELDGVGLEGCNTERCHHATQFYLEVEILWNLNLAEELGDELR